MEQTRNPPNTIMKWADMHSDDSGNEPDSLRRDVVSGGIAGVPTSGCAEKVSATATVGVTPTIGDVSSVPVSDGLYVPPIVQDRVFGSIEDQSEAMVKRSTNSSDLQVISCISPPADSRGVSAPSDAKSPRVAK